MCVIYICKQQLCATHSTYMCYIYMQTTTTHTTLMCYIYMQKKKTYTRYVCYIYMQTTTTHTTHMLWWSVLCIFVTRYSVIVSFAIFRWKETIFRWKETIFRWKEKERVAIFRWKEKERPMKLRLKIKIEWHSKRSRLYITRYSVMECVCVLQRVAVCCNVLQCDAVCAEWWSVWCIYTTRYSVILQK